MRRFAVAILAAAGLFLQGQEAGQGPLSAREPGVIPPVPVHRVEPEYPEQARKDRIQGSVFLQMVVDETGTPAKIEVLLPGGYGFDERAVKAVTQWRFTPAMKGGKPVAVRADVEVSFALPNSRWQKEFKKEEEQRAEYTKAIGQLMGTDKAQQQKAMERIAKLSKKKFPPAMFVEGTYLMSGELGKSDPERGRALLAKSAEMGFASALYLQGVMKIEGTGVEKDIAGGLRLVSEAASGGSLEAQQYLADAYANGRHGEKKPDDAIRYFRLCAVQGRPACQYQLARLLLAKPDGGRTNLVWSIAWLRTAAAGGHGDAHKLLREESVKLTPVELKTVDNLNLKARLARLQSTGMPYRSKRP